MNTKLNQLDKNSFIQNHLESDIASVALMKAPVASWDMREIAATINGYQKIKVKLPSWYIVQNLAFGDSLNIEQASSEETALFKQGLIQGLRIETGIDLCAGLGVDSYYLAQTSKKWAIIEAEQSLLNRTKHNFSVLGANNCTFINQTAEQYLTNESSALEKVDLVFLDPDRRPDSSKKRVYKFEDCSPNLIEILPTIAKKSKYLLVKSSPMMDLSEGLKLLPSAQVYVISVKNEVKEILWLLDFQQVDTETRPATIHAVELVYNWAEVNNTLPIESFPTKRISAIPAGEGFFILPSSGIMKAGLHKKLASEQNWESFSHSTHLYYSSKMPNESLPIRVFQLVAELPTNVKEFKKYGLKKAQVITKNDPLKPAELLKKYNLIEAGNDYILSFTNEAKKRLMVHTRRVH